MRKNAKSVEQVEETFIFREKETANYSDKRFRTKEFVIDRDHMGLFRVSYTAGGEVPDVLKGGWTSINRAIVAIDNYVASKKETTTA
jgi:hypothetical protein